MADERVAPKDFEPEPCEESGCKAPNGECVRWYEAGYVSCPVGPYRNYRQKVESRRSERRKANRRAGDQEQPQGHMLDAIAEYTVHATTCPYYNDGNCECAVEEFRATLRRVLVPSRLRAPSEGTREPAEGWTTDEPTEPGWYWTRTSRGHTEILRLTEGPDGKMWADDGSWCVDEVDNEWCGPLPAPPEHGEPSDG